MATSKVLVRWFGNDKSDTDIAEPKSAKFSAWLGILANGTNKSQQQVLEQLQSGKTIKTPAYSYMLVVKRAA